MNNCGEFNKEKVIKNNWKRPEILNYPNGVRIVDCSGTAKTNSLINLVKHQSDINKTNLSTKSLYEPKYQWLISKSKYICLKHFKHLKALLLYPNNMKDFYRNIWDYHPKNDEILTVFNDIIADILTNKKLEPIVTELVTRNRKLNISNTIHHQD